MIAIEVVANVMGFKAIVLHALTDQCCNKTNGRQINRKLGRNAVSAVALGGDGLYTSSPFVHRSSAFGWSAKRPSYPP
jgi:hypothetical protein